MFGTLSRNWGWVVLRGVIAVLFGVLALFNPGITLATLILLFSVYAMADGVVRITIALTNHRDEPHPVALLVSGVPGFVVGLIAFSTPILTAIVLLSLVAAWAIASGVVEVVVAIRLRKEIMGEWLVALAGMLGVAFGVFLILAPIAGSLALALSVGSYAMVVGVMQVALGFELRNWGGRRDYGRTMRVRPHRGRLVLGPTSRRVDG